MPWIGKPYGIEESIRGKQPDERRAARQPQAKALLDNPERWLHIIPGTLSRQFDTAAAILYTLKLWPTLIRYADDGRIEIDNPAAERSLRGIALGLRIPPVSGAPWPGFVSGQPRLAT
ncbi:IS66 family transposase [Massilia frigida]|uniref:IS66 family transposase n=1 Tax=Massilia frigida TaxID=2609281 RepID=UPI0022771A6F|nr:transposase [Massilia frigida]